MMKKITNIILMIVMLISLIAVSVYAQDTNVVNSPPTVSDVDSDGDGVGDTRDNMPENVVPISAEVTSLLQADVEVNSRIVRDVSNQNGAQVRVMQLMRNIEANTQGAELILRVAQSCECPEYERMTEIVNLLDVIAVDLEEFDFSRSSREMAQEFVELRSDAVELTTQFRELARQVISSEEEREELRDLTREVRESQREEFRVRIEQRVRDHQIEQFRELVVRLDIQADELVQLVVAGEVSIPDARQRLAQMLRERNQEEREQIVQRIREVQTRENVEVRERAREIQEIVQEQAQIRDERLEERLIDRVQRVEQRVNDRASPQLFEQVCQSAGGGGRSDRASAALFQQVCSNFGGDDSDEVSEEEQDRRLQNLRNERLNILNNRIERVQDRMQGREEVPQACTREYMPVCARLPIPDCPEGLLCQVPPLQTYNNACLARVAGAEVLHEGMCREDEEDRVESSTGGGAGKVSVADITFSSRTGGSEERLSLYTTDERFIQVEGDSSLVGRADIFLKIEGVEGESRVSTDEDGFLVAEVENLRSETRAMLSVRGIEGEIPVTVEPKSGVGDDSPTESLSFSYGRIKVTYEPQTSSSQGDSHDDLEERCERVEQRNRDGTIEVLSVCWGDNTQAAKTYNSTRSNRTGGIAHDISDNEEVDDLDRDSSTAVRIDADVRVEAR